MPNQQDVERFIRRMSEEMAAHGYTPLGILAIGPGGQVAFGTTQGVQDHAHGNPVAAHALLNKCSQAIRDVVIQDKPKIVMPGDKLPKVGVTA